jgi:hypothetical protein
MLSVVCWRWKPKRAYRSTFGSESVNILRQMVKRNYHKPHRFICVTDDPRGIDSDIEIIPLWDDFAEVANPFGDANPSCYRRLKMFSPEAKDLFGERFVSIDLDCVITGDLHGLWDRSEDLVCWGDTNPSTYYNGSMIMMTAGCRPQVWTEFDPIKSPLLSKAAGQFGSDQGWISYVLGPNEAKWSVVDGIYSYRMHIRNRRNTSLPPDAKLIMFHGAIDPWSAKAYRLSWVRSNWRYNPVWEFGIEAINPKERKIVLTDGRIMPIIELYNSNGDETGDFNEACSFVAGKQGEFWSGSVFHFRHIRPN